MTLDLSNQLFTYLHESETCYVFIDRSVPFPLEDALRASQAEYAVLDDPIFNQTPELVPVLVKCIRAQHQSLIDALVAVAYEEATDLNISTRSVCAFILSAQSLRELATQLKRQLDLRVTGFGNVYFRYFDPRVAPRLIPLLNPEQHWQWLHQTQAWLYLDWQGQLQTLPNPPAISTTTANSLLSCSAPIVSLAQWDQMEKIELENKTIQALRLHGTNVDIVLQKTIAEQLHIAVHIGLSETSDQITFAEYAIQLNTVLQQHPKFSSGLALVKNHAVPFRDVLEEHMNLSIETAHV
jgi:hypothetical protein